jgi:hypothetical protein
MAILLVLTGAALFFLFSPGKPKSVSYVSPVANHVIIEPGPHRPPAPLGRAATTADVFGYWQYQRDDPPATIDITFNKDGTFQQNVAVVLVQVGHWELQGNTLRLHDVLMYTAGQWLAQKSDAWEVVSSSRHPGQATLYGRSVLQPDAFREFLHLMPTAGH